MAAGATHRSHHLISKLGEAHRVILASRSPVFAAMFTGGMAEAKVPDGALAYYSGNKPISVAGMPGAVLRAIVHGL
jgi:hypothetical protein